MSTPTKKPIRTILEMEDIERAAKKENPFKDLTNKWMDC
jgi:hypothetical protein